MMQTMSTASTQSLVPTANLAVDVVVFTVRPVSTARTALIDGKRLGKAEAPIRGEIGASYPPG